MVVTDYALQLDVAGNLENVRHAPQIRPLVRKLR